MSANPPPATAAIREALEQWIADGYTPNETPLDAYGVEVLREVLASLSPEAAQSRPCASFSESAAKDECKHCGWTEEAHEAAPVPASTTERICREHGVNFCEVCMMDEFARSQRAAPVPAEMPPIEDGETNVYTIRVFSEAHDFAESGRAYAAEWQTGDGREAGMGAYAATPIGALAELVSTLIKVEEGRRREEATRP